MSVQAVLHTDVVDLPIDRSCDHPQDSKTSGAGTMISPLQSRPDEIHAIPYNRAGAALRREIALLQHRVGPPGDPPPGDPVPPEHDPRLDALSFYLVADGRVVSY